MGSTKRQPVSDPMLKQIFEKLGLMDDKLSDHGERLARLEANMHVLVGNGSPGAMAILETKVTANGQRIGSLENFKAKMAVIIAIASAAVGSVMTLVTKWFMAHHGVK